MKIDVSPLSPGTIHLWELDLDHFIFNDVLSEEELARAGAYRVRSGKVAGPAVRVR